MLIRTVTTVSALNSAGQVVEALPVREAATGETDIVGRPVNPIDVVEDANGVPVRFVTGKSAVNSAGQVVDTIAVKSGNPGLVVQSRAALPQPFVFRGVTPAIHIDTETGYVKIGSLVYNSLAAAEAAGVYNSTTKTFAFDPLAIGLPANPSAYTAHIDATTSSEAAPATTLSEIFFRLGASANGNNYIMVRRFTDNGFRADNNRGGTFSPIADSVALVPSTRFQGAVSVSTARIFANANGAGVQNPTSNIPAGTINKLEVGIGCTVHKLVIWYADYGSNNIVRALNQPPMNPAVVAMLLSNSRQPAISNGDDLTIAPLYFQAAGGFVLVKHGGIQPPHVIRRAQFGAGPSGKDDHNIPQFGLMPDGAVLIVQPPHGGGTALFINRCPSIDSDPVYLGTIVTGSVGTLAEYAKIMVRPSDGRVFLLTKCTDYAWAYFTSDDSGLTWSAPRRIFEDPTLAIKNYCDVRWLANGRLFIGQIPNSGGNDGYISAAEWDTETGKVYSGSPLAEIGDISVLAANVGVDQNLFSKVIVSSTVTYSCDLGWDDDTMMMRVFDKTTGALECGLLKRTGDRYSTSGWSYTKVVDMGISYFANNVSINGSNVFDKTVPGKMRIVYGYRDSRVPGVGRDRAKIIEAQDNNGTGPWVEKALVYDNPISKITFRVLTPFNASPKFPVFWTTGDTYTDYNSYGTFFMDWPGLRGPSA